jgi:HD-GYP domain-containing protein (c-di-GMP phosphodiesterase class II)
VAVADAYSAMTADRPYRRPFSEHRARAELQARAGTQFDHDVVEAFLAIDGDAEDPGADDAVPAAEGK